MMPRPSGTRYVARHIREQKARLRALGPRPSPDALVSTGPGGTSFGVTVDGDGGISSLVGVVTTAITARTGTASPFTLGKGAARICTLSFSGGNLIATTSTSGAALVVYNTTTSAVALGKLVQLKYVSGSWFVDVADC